ncbi:MAG: MraY family glycosyltransferase [Cyclobacteriaceae bacterium]|nr:MraY family glycosyltransferase [Cyclobacteriaceae bacterium]
MDRNLLLSGLLAFAIAIIATPIVVRYSKRKGFLASINHRSSHDKSVPNTGGIILYFSVLIPLLLFSDYSVQEDFTLMISAFSVLLITGVIDDFNPLPVIFKFLGQFIPAIVIVTSINAQELALPFLHNHIQLPGFFNYIAWIFFIVMTINAFNLIDGIDGLAIGMGISGALFYLIEFISLGVCDMAVFSFALICALSGLLFFNFSRTRKIFLGDTGSLFIGGVLVFFALKFINYPDARMPLNHSFFLVFGSIFIPLADMIRVALERISAGISPFRADRTHIHHLVLQMSGGNHIKSTTILVMIQLLVMFCFIWLARINEAPILLMLLLSLLVYYLVILGIKRKLRS